MSKYLFIKHSKTTIKPLIFSAYTVDKLIAFYSKESVVHPYLIFVYKLDDRTGIFIPLGYCFKGKFNNCSSEMFNFEAFINAELD